MKPADIRKLWQMQGLETSPPTAQAMERRASAFARQVRLRNRIEYGAAALVVAGFSYYAWTESNPIVRIGHIFVAVAAAYVVWQLYRRASPGDAPIAATTAEAIVHLRSEFAHQRDALIHIWDWYLLPFVPGLALLMAGPLMLPETGTKGPGGWLVLAPVGVIVLIFYGIWRLNRAAADRLQASIDELDRLREELE